jgi:predicted DNA-binding protein
MSAPRNKVSTTVYMTPQQMERLRRLNERTRVPMAVFIREAIEAVLNLHDPLPEPPENT